MLSGYSTAFELAAVNPTITAPTKIRLSENSDSGFIYLLEPSQKRIVVFDKQGGFILQYKIPSLTNIKDFAVLESEKKILLLNDASIYEIAMEETK